MKQDWKKVRLGEVTYIADYVANGSFASLRENVTYKDKKDFAILVRLADFSAGWNGNYIYVDEHAYNFLAKSSLKENDIVMCNVGSVGKCFKVPELGMPMTLAPNSILIRSNTEELNQDYLYYCLTSDSFLNKLQEICHMVAQPKFNKTDLKKIEIPLPPLATQTRIVHQLDLLTRLTTLKAQQLTHLHHLAHSTFHHLFGDPVENEKGWPVKPLIETVNEGCPISYGIVQPFEDPEGVPVVRPVDLTDTIIYNKGLKCTRKDIADGYKRTQLEGGEILLCVRGTTGLVSFADSSLKGCNVSRGITPLAFGEKVDPWFMYGQMKTPAFQQAIADITYGIALKGVSMATLRQVKVIVPPIQLQKTFAQEITRLHRLATTIHTTQTHLHHLLQTTLHHHFG